MKPAYEKGALLPVHIAKLENLTAPSISRKHLQAREQRKWRFTERGVCLAGI